MPMGTAGDTSPIGMSLDLSSREKIQKPIPTDETMNQSPVELPALYVLSNEGTLSMWWIIYKDSITREVHYPDLIAAGGPRPLSDKPAPTASSALPSAPSKPASFGASQAGNSSPFGPAMTQAGGSTFGTPSTPAFGGATGLGNRSSVWGSSSSRLQGAVFGQSSTPGASAGPTTFAGTQHPMEKGSTGSASFGQTGATGAGSAFGQVGGMGASKQSPWNNVQSTPRATPANASESRVFGGNAAASSPFMNLGAKAPTSNDSPFLAFGGVAAGPSSSPFAKQQPSLSTEPSGSTVTFGTASSFGSGTTTFGGGAPIPSQFGTQTDKEKSVDGKPALPQSNFGTTSNEEAKMGNSTSQNSLFGTSTGGFKLGSTFKGDGTTKEDLPQPKFSGKGMFGSSFRDTLEATDSKNSEAATPIKQEPGTEDEVQLADIPTAAEATEDKEQPQQEADAPLPPDPTTWKPKPGALPPPIPPGFGDDFVGKKEPEAREQPSQPDKRAHPHEHPDGKQSAEGTQQSPVGSSHSKHEANGHLPSDEAGPVDDDEDEWGQSESNEESDADDADAEEGSDEEGEVDEEEHEATNPSEITDQKGRDLFRSRITTTSPEQVQNPLDESETPTTDAKKSYTPVGLPKAPVLFPPSSKDLQQSPRSPSPVRNATSPQRLMTQEPHRKPTQQQPPRPQSKLSPGLSGVSKQRVAVGPSQLMESMTQRPQTPPSPEAPTAGELEDDEDERVQAVLREPIEPTREMPSFLAHQDYVSDASGQIAPKAGVGGQIERVYRDINSMIDTFALNARNLSGFLAGSRSTAEGKHVDDLDDEDCWGLGEASALRDIVRELEQRLERGRLENVKAAMARVQEDEEEAQRLRKRASEVRKQIKARTDPDERAISAAAPLPKNNAAQQSELRQTVKKVHALLANAEERTSELRAELASLPSKVDAVNSKQTPTVEAVTSTILKMTAMIEKKSSDIDVLEARIRRLGGIEALKSLAASSTESPLVVSRRASRYGSPINPHSLRSSMRRSRFSPSVMSPSPAGAPASPRKSLFDVSEEEIEAWRAKRAARREVGSALRQCVSERGGARVVRVQRS